eukprot:159613-Pyramimonas_sp.AAC.1
MTASMPPAALAASGGASIVRSRLPNLSRHDRALQRSAAVRGGARQCRQRGARALTDSPRGSCARPTPAPRPRAPPTQRPREDMRRDAEAQ